MKIAVIGAGFTGLAAAYELQKKDHEVTIFEKESFVAGLSAGFKAENWAWPLEQHYHHLFTNDKEAVNLMKEIGVDFLTLSPDTSILKNGEFHRLDSPLSLLKSRLLSFSEKIRVGIVFLFFKIFSLIPPISLISPISQMESRTAFDLLPRLIGRHAFDTLFRPLFIAKFGTHAKEIAAIWFWARIKKRTTKLIYPVGGFQNFADSLARKIQKNGGIIHLFSQVFKIEKSKEKWQVCTSEKTFLFDKILLTLPLPAISRLLPALSDFNISHLDCLNLVLETDAPILPKTYWLNINDENYPFLAIIQQTNLVERKFYAGHHICYLGNYLPADHKYFHASKEELINLFLPFIQKINPDFKRENIINSWALAGKNAQPVVDLGYAKRLPPINLSLINQKYEGLFVANMDMVYPWDRGINYAVEIGKKAAEIISDNSDNSVSQK